jgi:hypothetical protein
MSAKPNPDVEELLRYNHDAEARKWGDYCDLFNVIWQGFTGADEAAREVRRREQERWYAFQAHKTFDQWMATRG